MNYSDKPELKAILERADKRVGKDINQEDIEFFYNELKDYSLKTLKKAVEKAMRDRDPDDPFLYRTALTVQETRAAAERILEEAPTEGKVGCERCGGNAWITSKDKFGRLVAWPCECLYNVAKKALAKKKRPSHIDIFRRRIVKAYEYHEKHYGGL